MLLFEVVETSRRIAETTKRLEKTRLLAELLQRLHPDEVGVVVAWLAGRTPQGRIGIGYRTLQEAAGLPAEAPTLEITDVNRRLSALAGVQGSGSQRQRLHLIQEMFSKATGEEQHFLTRLLVGELRQGALEGIMVDAIAKASGLPLEDVRRAVMMAGDAAVVAQSVLERGQAALEQYRIQLFRPVQPMLAGTAEDIEGALAEMGEAALEYKMDGARIQVHRSGDDVVVFSRRLNDVTAAVPEVVEAVRALPAKELILDGEVISLEPDGRPRPFQETMRRFGRKLDVERMRGELPLTPFWFDLLYLDGASLLDEGQSRRFSSLLALSPSELVIPHTTTANLAHAEEFLRQTLQRGHEGVMAKAPNAGYAAGARGQSWLKVKQARTLDLVILAAEWGHGRRHGWLSNLHLGARDTEKGGFAMLGKTFKGLTDQMLEWQTQQLLALEIGRDEYTVYVAPKLVVEIAFNEIQVSPRYASGLALRFARVKRYRTDKSAEQTDTFQTVQRMASTAPPVC
jgi:DNA ligase-1